MFGNGQLLKLFSVIWCIWRLPWEDKTGTSLLDAKSRKGLTDSLLVGSIEHSDAYIDVYDVTTLKRSSQSYFMFSPAFRTLKKPRPQGCCFRSLQSRPRPYVVINHFEKEKFGIVFVGVFKICFYFLFFRIGKRMFFVLSVLSMFSKIRFSDNKKNCILYVLKLFWQ